MHLHALATQALGGLATQGQVVVCIPALGVVLIQGLAVGHQLVQVVVCTPDLVAVPMPVQAVAPTQALVVGPTQAQGAVYILDQVAVPLLGLAVVAITDQAEVAQINGIDHHPLVIELLF